MKPTERDWRIRLYVYKSLAASGRAPDAFEIGARFEIAERGARQALRRLHDAHALVLGAGDAVLMAHPMSAVSTDYRVNVAGVDLNANCAWDSLGIPAMLDRDAAIAARHPLTGDGLRYSIEAGRLRGGGGLLVHFAHPFRQWYDDIVET
ncbi:MAG: hypothetical protein F4X02_14310 [Chloroflexi bacterium]|nr:hypothetical protein [Chloroflexota bacterium]